MEYQIINFNPNMGSITVLYKNNGKDIATYNIDLPINNGLYPVGDELVACIMQMAPTWLIEREEKIKSGVANAIEIEALVIPLPPIEEILQPISQLQPASTGLQTL
jgi:hypothetical protein